MDTASPSVHNGLLALPRPTTKTSKTARPEVRVIAHAHGETGWRAHMFPLSVDGIEIVASLVLLADRRAGRRSGRLPWAALIAGTAASFAANVAVGGSDWIGRAVSGWPAFALLIAVKLLFGLLDHPAARPAVAPGRMVPTRAGDRPESLGTVAPAGDEPGTVRTNAGTVPVGVPVGGDGSGTVPADGDEADNDRGDNADEPDGVDTDAGMEQHGAPAAPTMLDVSALLPAARAARVRLVRTGRPVTRQALAREMRASGQPVSNARASALLRQIAGEPVPADAHHEEEAA